MTCGSVKCKMICHIEPQNGRVTLAVFFQSKQEINNENLNCERLHGFTAVNLELGWVSSLSSASSVLPEDTSQNSEPLHNLNRLAFQKWNPIRADDMEQNVP